MGKGVAENDVTGEGKGMMSQEMVLREIASQEMTRQEMTEMTAPEMTSWEMVSREMTLPGNDIMGNAVTGNDVTGITGNVMSSRGWVRGPRGMMRDPPPPPRPPLLPPRVLSRLTTFTYLSHACFLRCILCFTLRHARCNPLTRRNKRQARRNNLNGFI